MGLLLVVIALTTAPAADAAPVKAIWGSTQLNGASAFPTYRNLGVKVFQLQLNWSAIAPTKPLNPTDPKSSAYKWGTNTDLAISEAARNGMSVALLVRQTPGWANGNRGINVAPTNLQDYADFILAARRRYPQVNRWMIWGETNRTAVWNSGPRVYSDMVDRAYSALRSVDTTGKDSTDNTVVAGMTFTYGTTPPAVWMSQMRMSNGARPRFNEYGHNPFARRCPDPRQGPGFLGAGARDISDLDTFIPELRANFGGGKRFWLSEFTVSSDRTNRAFTTFVSRNTQAQYLSRAFQIASQYPADVAGLGWFNLQDESAANGLTTGLLTTSGAPKPSYFAYRAASMANSGAPSAVLPNRAECTPPTGGGPPPDVSPPAVGIGGGRHLHLSRLLRRGYRPRVSCSEACTIKTELILDRRNARRLRIRKLIGSAHNKTLSHAGTTSVLVKVKRRYRRRMRRIRRAGLALKVTVKDPAGNGQSRKRNLKLTR